MTEFCFDMERFYPGSRIWIRIYGEATYHPGSPGCFGGPPETHPPEPAEVEIHRLVMDGIAEGGPLNEYELEQVQLEVIELFEADALDAVEAQREYNE